MLNKEKLRQRFLRDPLPVRLGGLSATLGRISSSARESQSPSVVADLLDEAKHLIEWTAADAELQTAAELVQIQLLAECGGGEFPPLPHFRFVKMGEARRG